MVGNSWLAVSQWFIAAQHPPHLKCIAPFEGIGDIYREVTCRGGVPAPAFFNFIAEVLRGMSTLDFGYNNLEPKYSNLCVQAETSKKILEQCWRSIRFITITGMTKGLRWRISRFQRTSLAVIHLSYIPWVHSEHLKRYDISRNGTFV